MKRASAASEAQDTYSAAIRDSPAAIESISLGISSVLTVKNKHGKRNTHLVYVYVAKAPFTWKGSLVINWQFHYSSLVSLFARKSKTLKWPVPQI